MNPLFPLAEINLQGTLLIPGHMKRMANQLLDSLALGRRNGNYRDSKSLLHFIHLDRTAVFPQLIHHIQSHNHGNLQLKQLHGQIQIPFNIRGIHNIDNASGLFPDNKFSCYNFLAAVGRHGINSGQIRNQCIFMTADHSVLSIYSNSREISHMLLGACQLIKQCGFSAVLISHQRKGQNLTVRKRLFFLPVVELSALSVSRMKLLLFLGIFPSFSCF